MTSEGMHVSVAICTWNRAASLERTLERFTRLVVDPGVRWELLVVNNCCTDDTDRVVISFADRLPVKLLHEPRAGQSFARNLAVQHSQGQFLLWTDDDALVDPDWMRAILRTFNTFAADWVFGRSTPLWPTAPPSWYSERFMAHFVLLDYGPKAFVVTDKEQHFYGVNFAGTRAAHVRVGGFRTEFGLRGLGGGVGEDLDLFNRAFDAGMKIVYAPDVHVQHVIPAARTTKAYYRRRHWLSNEVVFKFLPEIFPTSPTLLGVPRFLVRKAGTDVLRWGQATLTGNRSEAFFHELQLVRFARFALEAARHGFRAPRRPVPDPMVGERS